MSLNRCNCNFAGTERQMPTNQKHIEMVCVKEKRKDKSNGSTVNQNEHQDRKLSISVNEKKRRQRSITVSHYSEDEGNEKGK